LIDFLFAGKKYKQTKQTKQIAKMNQTFQTESLIDGKVLSKQIETKQLGSTQDYCAQGRYNGESGEKVEWTAAFDGHGGNLAINAIRAIPDEDLNEIMKHQFPHIALQEIISERTKKLPGMSGYMSGTTMVLAKVFFFGDHNEVEITNIGDSTGMLYINKELVFITNPHNFENGQEMVRLITEGRVDPKNPIYQSSGGAFNVFSRNRLYNKTPLYISFLTPNGMSMELSPSQSLGHNGICGFDPTVTRFMLKKTDAFKVCVMSDGITDVMPVSGVGSPIWQKYIEISSAKDIVDMAHNQWKRDWTIVAKNNQKSDFVRLPTSKFPANGYDDCCCAVIEYKEPDASYLVDSVIVNPIIFNPIIMNPNPIVEDPILEDPIVEDPILEDPIVEDPIVEDQILEDEDDENNDIYN